MSYHPASIPTLFPQTSADELNKMWQKLTLNQQHYITKIISNLNDKMPKDTIDYSEIFNECRTNILCLLINVSYMYKVRDIKSELDESDMLLSGLHLFIQVMARRYFAGYEMIKDSLMIPLGEQFIKIKTFGLEQYLRMLGVPPSMLPSQQRDFDSQIQFSKIQISVDRVIRMIGYKSNSPTAYVFYYILYSGWLQQELLCLQRFPLLTQTYSQSVNTHFWSTTLASLLGAALSMPLGGIGTFVAPTLSWYLSGPNKKKADGADLYKVTHQSYSFESFCQIIFMILTVDSQAVDSQSIIFTRARKFLLLKLNKNHPLLEEIRVAHPILYQQLTAFVSPNQQMSATEPRSHHREAQASKPMSPKPETVASKPNAKHVTVRRLSDSVSLHKHTSEEVVKEPEKPAVIMVTPESLCEAYNKIKGEVKPSIWQYWVQAQIYSLQTFTHTRTQGHTSILKIQSDLRQQLCKQDLYSELVKMPVTSYCYSSKLRSDVLSKLQQVAQSHYYLIFESVKQANDSQGHVLASFFPTTMNFTEPHFMLLMRFAFQLHQQYCWEAFLVGSEIFWADLSEDHDLVILVDDLNAAEKNLRGFIETHYTDCWKFIYRATDQKSWLTLIYNSKKMEFRDMDIVLYKKTHFPSVGEAVKGRYFNVSSAAMSLPFFYTYVLPDAIDSIQNKLAELVVQADRVPTDIRTQGFMIKTLYKVLLKLNKGWKLGSELQKFYYEYYLDIGNTSFTLLSVLEILNKTKLENRLSCIWNWFVSELLLDIAESLTIAFIPFHESQMDYIAKKLAPLQLPRYRKGFILFLAALILNKDILLISDNLNKFISHRKLGFSQEGYKDLISRLNAGFIHVSTALSKTTPLTYFHGMRFICQGDLHIVHEIVIYCQSMPAANEI